MFTSKQRSNLKGLAMNIEPIAQVGKGGVSPNFLESVDKALSARELIKISVLETAPDVAKDLGNEIAEATNSTLVQVVGNKITLFKQRKKDSKIELPK